jgi:hypothetical protein
MKRLALATTSLILATAFSAPAALAGPQQERMTRCNAEAKTQSLSGDARKAFMKECLSGKTQGAAPATPAAKATPAEPATQQDKMTTCNKEASGKDLKGDERKTFMSGCLKG